MIVMSDHQIMDFTVTGNNTRKVKKAKKWSLLQINYFEFKTKLTEFIEKNLKQNADIEESIKMVQEGLTKICKMTRKKNKDSRGNVPWWNMDLGVTRSERRALRQRYQGT
ncbi:hypothetical protein AVEN_173377-1 [Araneus ventricosus]|uniref:Uncharacterized protein n=1 Tax=Araneus ventricosus TaxID=182803 RepID=A0A4Y2TQF1_ARAVE|nr:hypothetical protein AVEN_173377-1 [Araneus ventricosus]